MLQSKAKWRELNIETIHDELERDIPLEVSPMIEKLLLQRGITTASEARAFLSPKIDDLHDPVLLPDIEKASQRVFQAIKANEKILVFGDYDADGVTSTALLIKTLKELGAHCDFYIPNRFTEGYGPNEEAFHKAYQNGFSVIITVDTGIAATNEANVAKELGIDLIITDHHEPQNELPDAFAIIHPALSETYPFKDLAGVGVAFKFAQHLLGYFPQHLLELAAIGTIADLVSLKDENRVFVAYGLNEISKSHTPGISALKNICQIENTVAEDDIGFKIGPRLNAVGRLQDASLAVELLLTDSKEEAEYLAEEVDMLNQQRKKLVDETVLDAEKMVDPSEQGVIIISKDGWNEGILGIVASRLVEKFDRPAIVLTSKSGTDQLKGSARSIPAFDLFANCMKVRDLFVSFGGHAQAAGLSLPRENLQKLKQSLDDSINSQLSPEDFKQEIMISSSIDIAEINENLINEINQLSPFGTGNPKPTFKIKYPPADVRQIGSFKNHLKLQFTKDDHVLDGIAFGMGHLFYKISPQTPLNIVGELTINEWNGKRKNQMIVKDMEIDEWQLFDLRGKKHVDLSFLEGDRTLAVTNEFLTEYPDIEQIDYESGYSYQTQVDYLLLFDLPKNLSQLAMIIKQTKPANIYACYHIGESVYLTAFPAREDFIWFYALIKNRKKVDLRFELNSIMKAKSWSKERIYFIAQVFSELKFVKMDNEMVYFNPYPEKRKLEDSQIYRERLERKEIEKVLYYSTYDQLKEWLRPHMNHLDKPEEAMINGF